MTANLDSPGRRQLAWLEDQEDHLRLSWAGDVETALAELRAIDTVTSRALRLGRWAVDFPSATTQLIRVVSRDADLSFELATTFLGSSAAKEVAPEYVDQALAAAFPRLVSPWRDAAADRAGVRHILGINEGEGYESVPAPLPAWRWPAGEDFPAIDTAEGIQARLNYLGFGCGPINGEWNDMTRRAFVRWQISVAREPMDINPTENEFDIDARNLIELMYGLTPDSPN